MIATDMIYYAVATDEVDGGAQITASHNPKQYTGARLGRGNVPLSGDSRHLGYPGHDCRQPIPAPSGRAGGISSTLDAGWICRTRVGFIDLSVVKPYKVVLDAGCGMAGLAHLSNLQVASLARSTLCVSRLMAPSPHTRPTH